VQAIRDGVIDGGLAIVGAAVQTLAMVADRASSAPATSRAAIVSGAARALAGARPDVPLVRQALGAFIPDLDTIEIPSLGELRAAAGFRAGTVQAEHRALAGIGAAWLLERFGPDVDIVLVGEFGPASSASIGTTSSVLRAAAESGMRLRVWVADGEPHARSAALLRASIGAAPIDVQSIPDVRLHRLLAEHDVKVVLLGASWVGDDGTLAGQLGSVSAALLARRRGIQVVGVASRSMVVRGRPGHRDVASRRPHGGVPLELVDGQLVNLTLTDAGVFGSRAHGEVDVSGRSLEGRP
jgi:methylthioribose-1-phosphate isomerase